MLKRKKLIIFAVLAIGLAIVATAWFVRYSQENERKTAALVAVADQFKAPADWTLSSETINEAKSGCIDVRCPSVLREWKFAETDINDVDKLKNIVLDLGWGYDEQIGCDPKKLSEGFSNGCYLRGIVEGYSFTLIFRNSENGFNEALLTVD